MKLSLNLQNQNQNQTQNQNQNQNPLLKAEVPISIFNQPFTSIFTTTTTNTISDLTVSLSTNFPSGPSLKLNYAPSTTSTPHISPFSLSLKSGLGIFGSPHNSPLVFSAHFSLSSATSNVIVPTFSLRFKPQLGHFSFYKRATTPNLKPDSRSHSTVGFHLESGSPSKSELGNGFALDGSSGWQELKLEPLHGEQRERFANPNPNYIDGICVDNSGIGFLPERQLVWKSGRKDGFLGGVGVKARTVLPLTKSLMMNLRWGVNLPGDLGTKMPYLTVNKIGIERIEEVKEVKEKSNEGNVGDMELLKGMCFWMKRDLEVLEKENRDMMRWLEEMRLGVSARTVRRESNGAGKRVLPSSTGSLGEFEKWRSKKNDAEGSGNPELKKPANQMTDLESELQKAIKAASS